MLKVKIIVVGPCQSGKTVISNFLAEATESSSGKYQPTQGVRILEFESGPILVKGRQSKTAVELWDCSGDQKYEMCWPAFSKDAQGVVFVYSPAHKNVSRELDVWHSHFVQSQGVKDSQCTVFCHRKSSASGEGHVSQLCKLNDQNFIGVVGGLTYRAIWYQKWPTAKGVHIYCLRAQNFSRLNWVSTIIDDQDDGGKGGQQLKQEFDNFLERLLNAVNERRDQEELSIIGHG